MPTTSEPTTRTRKAAVIAYSHAGEILQGAIRRGDRIRRMLFSLPAPTLWTKAELISTPGQGLTIDPPWACKALSAAQQLMVYLDLPEPEAVIRLTSNIPTGKGCGSSTTDILATIRTLLAAFGRSMPEETVARLIVQVEQASDSSVLTRPAIFRHREGLVEEYLPGRFPALHVMVIDTQPGQTVDTVSMSRAYYSEQELRGFQNLIGRLREAFASSSAQALGSIATASARISQGFLPKPHLETLIGLVQDEQGYGLSVSHSGTVVSALLPLYPEAKCRKRIAARCEALGMRVLTEYPLANCIKRAHVA